MKGTTHYSPLLSYLQRKKIFYFDGRPPLDVPMDDADKVVLKILGDMTGHTWDEDTYDAAFKAVRNNMAKMQHEIDRNAVVNAATCLAEVEMLRAMFGNVSARVMFRLKDGPDPELTKKWQAWCWKTEDELHKWQASFYKDCPREM